jgi:poly-gamma-glutamate synthesis protein (capsule biosynthesis protein)
MCCILLACSSIIYALSSLKSDNIFTSAVTNTAGTASESSVEIAVTSDSSVEAAATSDSSAGTAVTTDSSPDTVTDTAPASATQGESPNKSSGQTVTEQKKELEQKPSAKSIMVSAVGDLMFHQGNLNNAYNPKNGTYNFSGFLEYVKPYLTKSDLTIGNFETVTAGPGSGYTSYPSFNTPDAVLPALSDAGFDILSTTNNHCLDRGLSGLISTLNKIKANKMISVGSSIDGKNKYITKEINGIKVSILAYSYGFNGNDKKLNAAQKTKYLSPINETQIKNDIKAVKAKGTDAVIVILHWGVEYQREPNTAQTALSKKVLSWGADIILGSHPHVIQKSEIVKINGKNKFIIYSMGNFISGYRRTDKAQRANKIYTEDGVIVRLTIEKDAKGGVLIKNVDYIPTWVDKNYVNNRPVFKILPIPSYDADESYITSKNKSFVQQSYKNTMDIMAKLK